MLILGTGDTFMGRSSGSFRDGLTNEAARRKALHSHASGPPLMTITR